MCVDEDARPFTVRQAATGVWHPLADLQRLAAYRDLFLTLTEHRVRVRYKQSVLGFAWAILQPFAMMLIFTLVFGRIARVETDGVPYPLFAFSGLVLWSFVSTSLNNATHALVAHAQLITKVYFPREILPLSYIAAALFDFGVATVVLLGMFAWYGRSIDGTAIVALPILAVAVALVTAIALVASALQVRFRDVGLAVPLVLYLWMFSTPIAYPLTSIPARYRPLFDLNPLTGLVAGFREAILFGRTPAPGTMVVPVVAAAGLLLLGYGLFKRAEATMADVI